jgi:hypothetical protein
MQFIGLGTLPIGEKPQDFVQFDLHRLYGAGV